MRKRVQRAAYGLRREAVGARWSFGAALACASLALGAWASQAAGRTPHAEAPDLPLVENLPPSGAPSRGAFVVLLTADGGWVASDKHIAEPLLANGLPVVAWDSRAWLQRGRQDAASAGRDLERVLRDYSARWRRDTAIVVGYSRGADIATFAINRLPPDEAARVRAVALVSPSLRASFEFHWIDLVRDVERPTDVDARPELARLAVTHPVLCNWAAEETTGSLCPSADTARVRVITRSGGHVLHGSAGREVGRAIVRWLSGLR